MTEQEKSKEDQQQRVRRERHRMLVKYRVGMGSVFVLLTVAIWFSVYKTMYVEGAQWLKVGETLSPPKEDSIPPLRGSIYASGGELLSISAPYYRLYFDFKSESVDILKKKGAYNQKMEELADALVSIVQSKTLNKKELLARWKKGDQKGSRSFNLIGTEISFMEFEQLKAHPALFYTYKNSKGGKSTVSLLRCIRKEVRQKRMHPYDELAGTIVGNVLGDGDGNLLTKGASGLEAGYDSLLVGKPGRTLKQRIGGVWTEVTLEEPHGGGSLYTTIDVDLQRITDKALEKRMIETQGDRGTAILMEVSTGRIVAMSNLSRTDSAHYEPSYCIAFNDYFHPGSVFKAATIMAALEDGVVTPSDLIDVGNGSYRFGRRTITDHGSRLKGSITVEQAIALSSNVAMAKIALKGYGHRSQHFIDKIKSFGFCDDLHLEIPGYAVSHIKDASDPTWSALSLPWIAHGYETQITPITLATFYAAIANGGNYLRPYLVDSIVAVDGTVLFRGERKVLRDSICKSSTAAALRKMLRMVVTDGTGTLAQSDIVAISGKSGTAQVGSTGRGYIYSASFCGMFPSEAPEYVCFVDVIHPRRVSIYGGPVSAPVVKEIAEGVTLHNNRYQPNRLSEVVRPLPPALRDVSRPGKQHFAANGKMPNVVGLSAADATYSLMRVGLKVNLQGSGFVTAQQPAAGSPVDASTVVTLTLESVPRRSDKISHSEEGL